VLDLILDTHAAIWWWTELPKLTPTARTAIERAQTVHVSAISALEITIKYRTGKLDVLGDPAVNYRPLMELNGFLTLDVTDGDALRAGLMPGVHRDPFDRVIAAQALERGLTVVTCDSALAAFGCKVLW
jgi:PIN domain nuclease of toxin-antitoxin system